MGSISTMDRSAVVTRAEGNRRPPVPPSDLLAHIEDLQSRIHRACRHALVPVEDAVRLQQRLVALRTVLAG